MMKNLIFTLSCCMQYCLIGLKCFCLPLLGDIIFIFYVFFVYPFILCFVCSILLSVLGYYYYTHTVEAK